MILVKSSFLLCIFFLCGPVAVGNARDTFSDFLLAVGSAGRVKLGMSKQEVVQVYRDHQVKEVDLFLEGLPAPALQVYKGKELLLTAELDNENKRTVYRIRTINPRFATREGIRVGSTFGRTKKHFGEPAYLGGGEGGLYAVFRFKLGTLSFRLHVEPHPLAKYATDQSKILEILVVR